MGWVGLRQTDVHRGEREINEARCCGVVGEAARPGVAMPQWGPLTCYSARLCLETPDWVTWWGRMSLLEGRGRLT